jgi:polar amino acid transport system permease protein
MSLFSRSRVLGLAIAAYTEWHRNVPGIAHLFILYFGLPALGVRMPPLLAAIVGLGLIGAASVCDILSGGLRSLHAGQREAALAVGLTPWQAIRWVLLPQALRITLPNFGNYACQLLKDTSIASAIAAPEIMFFARNLVTSSFDTTLIYLAVIGLYAALLAPVGAGFLWLERRARRAG